MKRVIRDFTRDWTGLTMLAAERWQKKPKPFMVTLSEAPKTWEQLGKLHKAVLPKFTQVMFDRGEIEKNLESYGKYHLKVLIGYGDWIDYKGHKVFDPHSFEAASTEILAQAIDKGLEEIERV